MTACLSSPGLKGFLGCRFQSRMVLGKLVPVGHCSGRETLSSGDRNNKIARPTLFRQQTKPNPFHSFSSSFFLSLRSFLPLKLPRSLYSRDHCKANVSVCDSGHGWRAGRMQLT